MPMKLFCNIFCLFFVTFLLVFCSFSCKNSVVNDKEGESFETFYQKFHADSAYQMSHILFPLEGVPDKVDSATLARGDFRWQQEDWELQKPVDMASGAFERSLEALNPNFISETILIKGVNLRTERRFLKQGKEWNLVYYAAPNKTK